MLHKNDEMYENVINKWKGLAPTAALMDAGSPDLDSLTLKHNLLWGEWHLVK